MKHKNLKEMFGAVWNDRPHISEISGERLIENQYDFHFIWQFAHVLGKQSYPRLKFESDNIILMTWKEHEEQTNGRYRDIWTKEQIDIFEEKRESLIQKYYNE